jgi:hypothetical protein
MFHVLSNLVICRSIIYFHGSRVLKLLNKLFVQSSGDFVENSWTRRFCAPGSERLDHTGKQHAMSYYTFKNDYSFAIT